MFILGFTEEVLMFVYGHLLDNKALRTSFVQWSDTHRVLWLRGHLAKHYYMWDPHSLMVDPFVQLGLAVLWSAVVVFLCLTTAGGCRHYKKFPYTWRFTFVTDKRKCVMVNSWWRSRKTSCIPRRTFVGPKWTVIDWFFHSSWMNWLGNNIIGQ
jgi:hypothetical protein